MIFKPATWSRIAVVLSVLNVLGAAFAAGQAEPWHATIHVALALGFGFWARRLRRDPGGSEVQDRLEALEAEVSRLEALEVDVSRLRRELSEAQERLDFTERMLARGPEAQRVAPQR
jgi:hypothetical protein